MVPSWSTNGRRRACRACSRPASRPASAASIWRSSRARSPARAPPVRPAAERRSSGAARRYAHTAARTGAGVRGPQPRSGRSRATTRSSAAVKMSVTRRSTPLAVLVRQSSTRAPGWVRARAACAARRSRLSSAGKPAPCGRRSSRRGSLHCPSRHARARARVPHPIQRIPPRGHDHATTRLGWRLLRDHDAVRGGSGGRSRVPGRARDVARRQRLHRHRRAGVARRSGDADVRGKGRDPRELSHAPSAIACPSSPASPD